MSLFFRKYFLLIYGFIVTVDLLACVLDSFFLNLVFKPLIVSVLLLYLFVSKEATRPSYAQYAVAGLCFSLFGDVLLIFQQFNSLFFIAGLVSFLLAHLFFIVYYIRSSGKASVQKLNIKPLLILLFGLYGIGFCAILFPWLGALRLPVFAYAAVLVVMTIFALNRFGKVSPGNFRMVMTAALLFTLSDSLLAVNKFVHPLPLAGIWIMSTYAVAQYLITQSVCDPNKVEGAFINQQ